MCERLRKTVSLGLSPLPLTFLRTRTWRRMRAARVVFELFILLPYLPGHRLYFKPLLLGRLQRPAVEQRLNGPCLTCPPCDGRTRLDNGCPCPGRAPADAACGCWPRLGPPARGR